MQVTALGMAQRWIGIKELPGNASNLQISAWTAHASVGQPNSHDSFPDEIAWCGSFVHNICFQLGLPVPAIPIRARSWLTVGERISLDHARPGWDIVILNRGGSANPNVLKGPGHVGFFKSLDRRNVKALTLVGGNQNNAVTITEFNSADILGIRRLWNEF